MSEAEEKSEASEPEEKSETVKYYSERFFVRFKQCRAQGSTLDEAKYQAVILARHDVDESLASVTPPNAPGRYGDLRERMVDGASFVLDTPEQVPTILGVGQDVLWARGEPFVIVGPAGVGKSTVAQQLGVGGRLGIFPTMFGWPVEPGERNVLYLAADRPPQIARSMRRMFSEEHRDILAERLLIWKGPPPADFVKDTDLLGSLCADADADTVIIDSLKDVATPLSEDGVGAAFNISVQRTLVAGVEVLGLHHMVKRGANGGSAITLPDVYGSTWITAGSGSVVLLSGAPGDPIVNVRHLKPPADEVAPFRLLHDNTTGRSEVYHGVDTLAVVQAAGWRGTTAKLVAMALYETEKPSEAQQEKARRRVEGLVASGHLRRVEGRRGGPDGTKPATYYGAAFAPAEEDS